MQTHAVHTQLLRSNYTRNRAISMFYTGYQHVRMYDVYSGNPNPVCNYNGMPKNVTAIGFHEDGKWMFTGGEDNSARIWDLR